MECWSRGVLGFAISKESFLISHVIPNDRLCENSQQGFSI
jgi:hypothetical protein